MILAATSDTHGRAFEIPPCDVFIHAGDITAGGSLAETAAFANWLAQQTQAKHKLITAGNHDGIFQQEPDLVRGIFSGIATVLIDESVTIEGVKFYASPWTTPFMNWYYMAEEEKLAQIYEGMPDKLDVLITHGPPMNVFDEIDHRHVGSTALLDAVKKRSIERHIFGHIHAGGGRTGGAWGTTFFNVAACDEAYRLVRQPLVLEI